MGFRSSGGKKKVKITDDGFGLEFHTMRNGYQWTGFGTELLTMMKEAIDEYFFNSQTVGQGG